MNDKETRVYKKTKLRNLKRKYARIIQHSDLIEEAIDLKCEIDFLESELKR